MSDTPGERYSRQVLFSAIGAEGQGRLRAARVMVAGCGGLGAVSAELLARAGAGTIRLVDRDIVELSNLQRQSLFDEDDVRDRTPKAVAAARHISLINSDVATEPKVVDISPANIESLIDGVDIVVDGFDNFEGRYLLNDACVKARKPWVYGGCVGSYGVMAFILPGSTPCLRCLFRDPPPMGSAPTCDTAGVISPALHTVSSLQVAAAMKWIAGVDMSDSGGLVSVDVWDRKFDALKATRNVEGGCPCCVKGEFEFLNSAGASTTTLCGRNSVQVCPPGMPAPDFDSIEERLSAVGNVQRSEFVLFFEVSPYQITLFGDGRAIVKGTTDAQVARSVVSRYLGV